MSMDDRAISMDDRAMSMDDPAISMAALDDVAIINGDCRWLSHSMRPFSLPLDSIPGASMSPIRMVDVSEFQK